MNGFQVQVFSYSIGEKGLLVVGVFCLVRMILFFPRYDVVFWRKLLSATGSVTLNMEAKKRRLSVIVSRLAFCVAVVWCCRCCELR
jgi:hypothetical protein